MAQKQISFRDPQKAFGAVVWFLTLFREAKISLFSTSVVVPGSDALSKQGMPERSTDGPPIAAGNHRAQYNVAGINSSTALIRPAPPRFSTRFSRSDTIRLLSSSIAPTSPVWRTSPRKTAALRPSGRFQYPSIG